MDPSKIVKLAEQYLKLAKKYNAPRKGMKSRWTTKYKRNIDCSNPKGFSQKAYCARKRRGGGYKSDVNDLVQENIESLLSENLELLDLIDQDIE